ncbi:MAG: Dipeptidyl aminopeptidase 4 [Owenweeksia sp. TMED14]|nr:MAG: Dipeptidyl aminopeptidase 4 [Owenweeksia sp. TMED14]
MRKALTILFGLSTFLIYSQNKNIKKSIEFNDVFASGEFTSKGIYGIRSMEDGLHYSRQTNNGIEKFEFKSGKSKGILISNGEAKDLPGNDLSLKSYSWTKGEKKAIIETEIEPIYRHSYRAKTWIFDLQSKKTTEVSSHAIQNPVINPLGKSIAYVYKNNVFIKSLIDNKLIQVTNDGLLNKVINGAPDWVYEEEFGFHIGLRWSHNGRYLAYYRFDETNVSEFSMDIYGADLYPHPYVFKYPKAGEENSKVDIWVYDTDVDLKNKATRKMKYEYIPRINWSPTGELIISTLNRHQDSLNLFSFNPDNKNTYKLLLETDDSYVDADHAITFLKNGNFIWMSDRSGYNHIYLFDIKRKKIRALTRGDFEVTKFYGVDEEDELIYYQAAKISPSQREIYKSSLRGRKAEIISPGEGWNGATFSTTFKNYILHHSDANTPVRISLCKNEGTEIRVLEDNFKLREILKSYNLSPKEFFTLKTDNGQELPAWQIKPLNFDFNKKYPVLMFVYGGPGSQTVENKYGGRDYWYQMLAAEGYWIISVDNRGTGAKGRDFKKCTYLELGKLEVEDQISAARTLAKNINIDSSRIGIWGWSYGGFMAANCILKGSDVFKTAISVAPVTSWRFYDNIYTERYMRTPQENGSNYDENSPLSHADKLKGNYLLIHGTGDDNVHVQNSMRLSEALIQENKQFDFMLYPDKNHGIYGGMTSIHLYSKISNFIREKL